MTTPQPNPTDDLEAKAWSWLNLRHDCSPADIDYSADEMIDAFMAGAALRPAGVGEAHRHMQEVAEAFRRGAMSAIGCERWDDADDFFSLVGIGYAGGEPLPPTMPKPRAALSAPAPSQGSGIVLWAMHIRGPDDLYPAPDYDTAVQWCDMVNDELAPRSPDVMLKAMPCQWPYSADRHAEVLPATIAEWTRPLALLEPRP